MSIRVVCPSCEKVYNLDDNMRGKKVQCRECKKPFEIPRVDRQEKREEDRRSQEDRTAPPRPPRDERIVPPPLPTRTAGARVRRDEEDEPRSRSAGRTRERERDEEPDRSRRSDRSRRDEDDKSQKSLVPILAGVGAGVVLLIGLIVGGLVYAFSGKSGPGTNAAAGNNSSTVPAAGGASLAGGGDAAALAGPVPTEMAENVVKQVIQSTAYLRVKLPNGGIAQGSGFFALEPGIVITNAHVLGMLRADSLPPHNVDVVTNSGLPGETKMVGTVLGVDRGNDLAVLRVDTDPSRLPPPLAVDTAKKLTQTQKVYIFGFPYGDQLGKGISVSTSSITSLRHGSNGILEKVQVNGGMHPGNSGGPVTDARGVVVGVSVSVILGTQINFAIPGDFVKQVVDGKIAKTEMGFAYRSGSEIRLPVTMSCLDPMNRIREVKVDVWTGPAGAALPASSDSPRTRPGDSARQSFSLSARDGRYVGDVVLPSAAGGQAIWIQPMMVNGAGVSQWDTSVIVPNESQTPLDRRAAMIQFKPPTSPIETHAEVEQHYQGHLFPGHRQQGI